MSVSWPTAEMVGTRTAASARQTASVLNAARSSRSPPPRPTMQTSTPGSRLTSRSARTSSSTAPSPCTRAPTTRTRTAGPAPAGHGDDVAERRACRAGHHRERGDVRRQRPLARGVEEAVLLQQRLDPLELLLRLADGGGREHPDDVELELALGLVHPRACEDEHLGAVGRRLGAANDVPFPQAAAHLAGGVAESEVPVAARPRLAADDLAPDPERTLERALDDPLDRGGELGDRPDVVAGGDQVGEQGEGHRTGCVEARLSGDRGSVRE